MRQRIAIWLHGGIGTGHFSQGQPILEKILERLSDEFDLVVYSQSKPNDEYQSKKFIIQSPGARIKPRMIRWLLLMKYFVSDHRKQNFKIAFAIWGYPAGVFAVLLGKIFGLVSIIYLQGGDAAGIPSISYGVFHKYWPGKIAKWTYNQVDSILCLSQYQQDQLINFGITRDTLIIPIGVDLAAYPFKQRRLNKVLTIIHVGHMSKVKDQATLLNAFALIVQTNPATLEIFGVDAGLKGNLVALCKSLNIAQLVKFKGMVPYAEMPQHYASADLILLTSLSEGQNLALAEAAASGVLMAGTKVGLLYDLDDTYAIRVDIGDYHALATHVLKEVNDPEKWDFKIHRAREWVEQHSLDWTVEQLKTHLKYYRS